MAFNYRVERNSEEASLYVTGAVTAPAADVLFQEIAHLIDGGYRLNVDLRGCEFVGLGAVRALKTAALRGEHAGVALDLQTGPAAYRIADLVGAERWSPLPAVAFDDDLEDDSVAV